MRHREGGGRFANSIRNCKWRFRFWRFVFLANSPQSPFGKPVSPSESPQGELGLPRLHLPPPMRNGSPKVASSRALDDELDELELPDSPTGSFIGGGSAPTVNLDVVTSELETIANTVEQFTPREPTAPAAAANSQSGEVEAQQKQRRPTAKADAELRQPYHPELPKGEVPLVDLFNYRRLHLSNGKPLPCRSKFLWILWLFPVGIVIFILRWLLFTLVSCTLTCALMCCGRTSCSASMAQRVAVRTMCFIFCIRVKIHNRENLPNRDTMPPIIVSNHLSELDFMAVQNLQFSRVLAMDIYRTMPFIGTILKSINTVFVPRLSRGGKREEVRAAVLKHLDSVVRRTGSMEDLGTIARTDKPTSSNKDQPILVFPEGGLTNGHHGLMRYHQFMFSLGLPVLPLAVSLRPVLPYS